MNILGVTAPVSWNNAAALVQDGRLVAAAEEERFVRVKQAPRMPAVNSARFCIRQAGIEARDVDVIAVGFKGPFEYTRRQFATHFRHAEWRNAALSFASGAEYAIQQYKLKRAMEAAEPDLRGKPWVFVDHHLAHAASTFFVSGFAQAAVLTLDGNGEDDSGLSAIGRDGDFEIVERRPIAHSLGVLYGNATQLLGFTRHLDEGKLMGLAAYGEPRLPVGGLRITDHGYSVARRYNHLGYWREFTDARAPGAEIRTAHKDIAASTQRQLELAGVALARGMHARTGLRSFCLAGGVALNCDMNAKIRELDVVDDIYIQPAAHDAGTALGAALEVAVRRGEPSGSVMDHAFWGPEYSSRVIQSVLDEVKVPYERPRDIARATAELLRDGAIVGWFQGRMELGPRALGARSILAHPGIAEMKDRVNAEVKHREGWRPFAPSILEEEAAALVEDACPAPFMLLTFTVRREWRERLTAATHVDGTVRIQTVSARTNARYHQLIEHFRDLTGIPAVLNTSFNDRGEPIVMTPRDALRTFFSTGLEHLAIGDFLVSKRAAAD